MTSGEFRSIEISSIVVDREGRQRRELENIGELAESISRLGLIQPIVITRSLELVAGERRLAACRSLGHTRIAAQYVDELDEFTLLAIELEENVKRSELPWKDQCLAIYNYFERRRTVQPDFSQEKLGDVIGGYSRQWVSKQLAVAKEILAGNPRVIEAPLFSTAFGITDRALKRRDDEALHQFRQILNIAKPIDPDPILNLDFNSWAPTYDGPRFNFIHCDFPYGIEADTFNQGAAATHGGYADTEPTYWRLCDTLTSNLDRLTTESCHFMFWFSMHHYQATLDYFSKNGDIDFDPFPLVWHKSDNVGILPDPSRGPRRIYETAFFGSRGDRKIVRAKSNAYAAPAVRDTHMSIKPEPVLRNFFEMFVDESTLMLDPTCGSGSSLRAAESLSARYTLGLEINPDFAAQANRDLKNARNIRKARGE